jgi:hypothetical protein
MSQAEIHYTLPLPNQRRRSKPNGTPHAQPLAHQLPRITRLMALAIKFEGLLGEVAGLSYADLARLGGVSPSHITHILNLLYLAPDLQERLLFLEPSVIGRDRIYEADLRPVTQLDEWGEQRRVFATILAGRMPASATAPLKAFGAAGSN